MPNPNQHFKAAISIISIMGFSIFSEDTPVQFLQNDTVVLRATFKYADGHPLETQGITIKMKIGATDIDGVPYDYTSGFWLFTLSNTVTSALPTTVQDAGFVLTRTADSTQTYIRIPDAIQALSIT